MSKIPDRFVWATDLLALKPKVRIMEWGCGAGLWADEIMSRFNGDCSYTGMDKSAAQIRMAEKRNHRFVDSGVSAFQTTDLNVLKNGEGDYDFVLAFNLNLFRKDPNSAISKAKTYLKTTGKLVVCFQNPSADDPGPEIKSLEMLFRNEGFKNVEHHTFFGDRYPCACVMGMVAE